MFLFFVLLLIIYLVYRCMFNFSNPYDLTLIFGKKGSGKSTLLAKYAHEYLKKGWNVYSTTEILGTYKFNAEEFGKIHFYPNSLIIIDEVGMIWDNRNFKNFRTDVRDFFKLQRHYKCKIILASQSFDVDKKIRDLTDFMYIVRKHGNFSIARPIYKRIKVVNATQENSRETGGLLEDYQLGFLGSRVTFLPFYKDFFNSFDAPQLKLYDFKLYSFNYNLKRRFKIEIVKNAFKKFISSLRIYNWAYRSYFKTSNKLSKLFSKKNK